jgi:hypothetical protein
MTPMHVLQTIVIAAAFSSMGCVIHNGDGQPIGRPLTGPKTKPEAIVTYIGEAAPAPECASLVGTVSGEAGHAFVNRITLERHCTEILKEEASKLGANAVVVGPKSYTGIYQTGGTHVLAAGNANGFALEATSTPPGVIRDRVAATGVAILVNFECAEAKPLVNLNQYGK